MQLVINNVRVMTPKMVTRGQDARLESEVVYMGGKFNAVNPTKVEGDKSSLTVEIELVTEAQTWRSKDNRSGAMIGTTVRFGAIVEASPLKK